MTGPADPRLAQEETLCIVPDEEYRRSDPHPGVMPVFAARPGPVTLLQLRQGPTGFTALLFEGKARDGGPWAEAYPHALVRPDPPVDRIYRAAARLGSTQHFALTPGRWGSALSRLLTEHGVLTEWIRR